MSQIWADAFVYFFAVVHRMYRKRCQGRLRKFLGDLCLLAGVPSEAIAHYQTALDILRSSADWLWLGGECHLLEPFALYINT